MHRLRRVATGKTSVMSRIVVSDIFGRTAALEDLCGNLPGITDIVDPYDGQFMAFESESAAYSYFIHNVGLKIYAEKLSKVVSLTSERSFLIGFSVGASAIWLISEQSVSGNIAGAVCFYGSQIRNSTRISPRFPVHIVLPKKEAHFSVLGLSRNLEKKENVEIQRSAFLHGFMNARSKNFCQAAYKKYMHWLCNASLSKPFHS
jgi:hypothetical protein